MKTYNILYLSGTRETVKPNGEYLPFRYNGQKVKAMSKYGDNIIDAEIYWDRGDYLAEHLCNIVEKENIDVIVGYSAGGYLGFYLCNKYKLPGLHINPALGKNCEAPKKQTLTKELQEASVFNNQTILIGLKDTVVNPDETNQKLKEVNFGGNVIYMPDMEHRINFKDFKKSFKTFREKLI